ncbi:hypothetical protein D3C83_41230 [compost metagenome]
MAVRILGAPEDGAFFRQRLQAAPPVGGERGQVLGAELVGDRDDDQPWLLLRGGRGEPERGQSRNCKEEAAHVWPILCEDGDA